MLHCDPVKCEENFPRLLETVPSRMNTNIVIVIDSVDKLQVGIKPVRPLENFNMHMLICFIFSICGPNSYTGSLLGERR